MTKTTTKKGGSSYRLQLVFSPQTYARIDELKEQANCTTKTELIRQALAVFEFFIRESAQGSRIQSISKNGDITQIVMPTFGTGNGECQDRSI